MNSFVFQVINFGPILKTKCGLRHCGLLLCPPKLKIFTFLCFLSCFFPSLSIKEGFGFGFGPFVGILMEFKGNEQDETDLWFWTNFLEVNFVFYRISSPQTNFVSKINTKGQQNANINRHTDIAMNKKVGCLERIILHFKRISLLICISGKEAV